MRPAAIVLVGWGAWLAALAGILWIWTGSELAPVLLSGAAAGAALIGLYVQLRSHGEPGRRRVTDSSVAVLALAAGIALGLVGLTAGPWLILVGAEVAVFGIGLAVRELRAERRAAMR